MQSLQTGVVQNQLWSMRKQATYQSMCKEPFHLHNYDGYVSTRGLHGAYTTKLIHLLANVFASLSCGQSAISHTLTFHICAVKGGHIYVVSDFPEHSS